MNRSPAPAAANPNPENLVEAAAAERGGEDQDRDRGENPKSRRDSVQRAIRIVDGKRERVVAVGHAGSFVVGSKGT